MTQSTPSTADANQSSLVQVPLTPVEVVELWSFVHGDIMTGGIRQLLHAHLGLCRRHTWGYAVTEIELWQTGAGPRGGHQPFDVCVLYEDLLDHVAAQLRRPGGLFHHNPQRVLIPKGDCPICLQVNAANAPCTTPVGYPGGNPADLAAETNRLTYTTAWCQQTRAHWQPRLCPRCAAAFHLEPVNDSTGSALANDDRLCRPHLLSTALTPESARAVAARLEHIAGRVRRLGASMTQDGPAATPEEDSSWIEALGWFAGWQVPLTLAANTE